LVFSPIASQSLCGASVNEVAYSFCGGAAAGAGVMVTGAGP
jgi:hypothetical protein